MRIKKAILLFALLLITVGYLGGATVYGPVKVSKSATNKIYVHLMPWFESKDYSGYWGQHWTMANQNPDAADGSGRRQIASYYYPLIGPYASGDPDLIEYQLVMMKLAGVDGVLIDWPGTTNAFDYVRNRQNSDAVVAMMDKVGLQFAVVYEDNNLTLANVADKVGQAKNDMIYARDNFFSKSSYIKINNAPLLMDFGPQTLTNEASWTSVFSVLPTKPTFLTLWYEHDDAGVNCKGEYSWIYGDYLTGLDNFYANRTNYGTKMASAYPGFNAFYQAGGWGSNPFNIAVGTSTFQATLDKAFQYNMPYIQLATWNDFGEGTMIEPTRELGYSCLTYLQQKIGVSYRQPELELVYNLYQQRKQYKGNAAEQDRLTQVFYYLVSLQIDAARNLLNGTTPPPTTQSPYLGSPVNIPGTIEAENFDKGGENVAFHDAETANQGGQYRTTEGVDIEVCGEGGYNVGWTASGEWMEYAINVPTAGTYNIECRVASGAGGSFSIAVNDVDKTGALNVPNTGGWQNWQSVSKTGVSLSSGSQILRVNSNGGFNLNKIIITLGGGTTVPVTGVSVSPTSASIAINGTTQLNATIAPSNATNKSVTWTSSNTAIATVSTSGLVTGKAAGSATITVKTNDGAKTATTSITVTSGGTTTYYQLKNRWQNTFLYDNGTQVSYGTTPGTNTAYQWILEDVGSGLQEIKNRATGEYMHVEHLYDYVECTARTSGWMSSRWALENTGDGYVRIRNAWQSTQYINVENLKGYAQHTTINTAWASAQWQLVAIAGSSNKATNIAQDNKAEISFMPNPVDDILKIELNGNSFKKVTIYDITGKLQYSGNINNDSEIQIDLRNQKPGLYYVKLISENNSESFKVIKK